MISLRYEDQAIFARQFAHKSLHLMRVAEFVISAMNEKFWFGATPEISEIRTVYRHTYSDELSNARILATDAQSDPAAKAESSEKQGSMGELRNEIIDGSLNVALLPAALVVRACA